MDSAPRNRVLSSRSGRSPEPGRESSNVGVGGVERSALGVILAGLTLLACGGDGRVATPPDAQNGPERFLEAAYPPYFAADDVRLSGALIARGDSIFHGAVGRGNCSLCHGPFLRGGSPGTNLRDTTWHNGDGSYAFIITTIVDGIDKPDHIGMPPRGGMPMSAGDVRAVAAYVYWVSRAKAEIDSAAPPAAARR